MGLTGGPNGAKAIFQKEFPGAFRSIQRLDDVRKPVGMRRSQTLVVMDGNVMMNAIPASVDTFRAYVAILSNQLNEACQAAAHVVVVFDEPKAMTEAKRDEQSRRDEMRQARVPLCSEEMVASIFDDDYHTNDLRADGCNVKLLMEFRRARPRFYDAVCVELLRNFRNNMEGDGAWSLTFDGIDPRGGDRGIGVPREAGILSTDAWWCTALARETPIGEGDLKLTDVTQRVHDAARRGGTPVDGVMLNLVVTIDTDSFAIELLQQNRRERRAEEADRDELTILCLKERPRKRKGDDFVTGAHYLCCDMQSLHGHILDYFYGTRHLDNVMTQRQPAALALLTTGIACCGCDFVEIKGMRIDYVLPAVRDIVLHHSEELDKMASIFIGGRKDIDQALLTTEFLISKYVESLESVPRMQKTKALASNYCDAQVLRALWTCAYWHQREFKDCSEWGFPSLCK